MCCRTETEIADHTFYLTQSQHTDTGPISPNPNPVIPGAWEGSHRITSIKFCGVTRPRKKQRNKTKQLHAKSGNRTQVCRSRGGRLNHWANEATRVEETELVVGNNLPGNSLAWGLNLRAVVCGIFRTSSPGVFLRVLRFPPLLHRFHGSANKIKFK